ncbi:hypothetical protein J4V10_26220, partial [Escherichia coli]
TPTKHRNCVPFDLKYIDLWWVKRRKLHTVIARRAVFMNSEKRPSTQDNHSFLPVLAATYLTHEVVVAIRGLKVRII